VSALRGRFFSPDGAGGPEFFGEIKGNTVIKGSAKDQPSYRMIQSVEPETLLKQAADHFRLTEAELTRKTRGSTGKNASTGDGVITSIQWA
jgi:hypothetical protein